MKNITLAMVTVLAAVAMLSAVLAVPMQQAIASSDGGGGGGDENSIDSKIKQKNDCGGNEDLALTTCANTATVTNIPAIDLG
jgi:hypothetical protein